VARTAPLSQPSNVASVSTSRTTALADALYCTIDTSRVEEGREDETQVGYIRAAIKKEVRESKGQEK
jgi:hypothetical protein